MRQRREEETTKGMGPREDKKTGWNHEIHEIHEKRQMGREEL